MALICATEIPSVIFVVAVVVEEQTRNQSLKKG
jgi:hypothetical protein